MRKETTGSNDEVIRRRPGRPRSIEPTPAHKERLDEIIGTAARVFHAKGYQAGSLDDVASALDLSKASLYHYVPSKAYLLYLIFDRAISNALDQLHALERQDDDAAHRLEAFIRHQVQQVAGEPDFFAVFFDQRPSLESEYEARIRKKEREYVEAFQRTVNAAVEAGVIPSIDSRHGAYALLGMCSWVYKWVNPDTERYGAIADDFIRLMLGPRPESR